MKTYLVFAGFVVVMVGAYLDLLWLSALGLALVGLFAILPVRKRSASCPSSQNPPTVFRK